jgi:peptidoglycan/xylan/chitin deacetylase (PgdA/CDA1 family)
MDSITLCYHDIVDGNDMNASGFSGAAAATYKLTEEHFRGHIKAIARTAIRGSNDLNTKSKYHVRLTFDDGGASSCRIADILECYGLRGYFFIPTDYIGRSSFISVRQIVDLQRRGHIIGSHSCSHHGRMSHMPTERLMQEWARSLATLSNLIGERVTAASVPSGYYSRRVAETAALAGIRLLFTLEPTIKTEIVDGCVVAGRFVIRKRTSAEDASAIASGALLLRLQQQISWKAKKTLKATPIYKCVRNLYFDTRHKLVAS